MTLQISLKKNDWSSIMDHDLAICVSVNVSKSGHSDLGIFNNVDSSSLLTWVLADAASAACPAQAGSLDFKSITFAAVICDADDLCSVNTA